MALQSPPRTASSSPEDVVMSNDVPNSAKRYSQPIVVARRRSTISSSESPLSSTTTSSPDVTFNVVITPESDDEPVSISWPVHKVEELGDSPLDEIDETKVVVPHRITLPGPRKRGRPRKTPVVEQKKAPHARSKTGCATCRRRKKKCDETKPTCMNCVKNNVVCEGYEPRQSWQGGRSKTVSRRGSSLPPELPLLVDGVDGRVDQLFFEYFTCQVGKVLSLTDHHNPFLEIIVPMAMSHTGLMHSLLYLSGSCLIAGSNSNNDIPSPAFSYEWEERSSHHSSKAIHLLQQDLTATSTSSEETPTIDDPSIAQTLVLCLQTVASGDLTGTYRFHLNAMKEMLTRRTQSLPNEQLRQFILEFLIYHDYSSSITSLSNPLDQRSLDLMRDFHLPEFMMQPQVGTLLGVLDGLFGFISRIRNLRDKIRSRRASSSSSTSAGRSDGKRSTYWWDPPIMSEAFHIDNALRQWSCIHPPSSPRYPASLLYRQCTWIYLHRTIQLSRPSSTFSQAVDEGLEYLRMLPWDDPESENSSSAQSILLMPLFLLGCAAFEERQRPEIHAAFVKLQQWSNLGNIKYARMIVEQIWEMMDQGREEETWDWEGIIAKRGWDFLVT